MARSALRPRCNPRRICGLGRDGCRRARAVAGCLPRTSGEPSSCGAFGCNAAGHCDSFGQKPATAEQRLHRKISFRPRHSRSWRTNLRFRRIFRNGAGAPGPRIRILPRHPPTRRRSTGTAPAADFDAGVRQRDCRGRGG